eukprot:COSAG05_NODE_8133_length_733_cov_4.876202_1_plen_69_part_00
MLDADDDDHAVGTAFAAGLALSDFAKDGLGGRVEVVKAQTKLGAKPRVFILFDNVELYFSMYSILRDH